MPDGATQVVEIGGECPKCGQESMVRVAAGHEIESLRKSLVCGQLTGGPFMYPEPKSPGAE